MQPDADAAAALAAVGAVFKPYDAAFSQQAITKARRLFKFATDADDGRSTPKSYCQFVPCTTNVTVKETVSLKGFAPSVYGYTITYYSLPVIACRGNRGHSLGCA